MIATTRQIIENRQNWFTVTAEMRFDNDTQFPLDVGDEGYGLV